MDKKNERILRYLLNESIEGRYVVIKVADMLERLHLPDNPAARTSVVEAVKSFVDSEYIGCKYYDSENICCVSMPRGRAWTEESTSNMKSRYAKAWFFVAVFAVVLAAAFLGSFLGGLV